MKIKRREFLKTTAVGLSGIMLARQVRAETSLPKNNPIAHLNLGWTDELAWERCLDITTVDGAGEFWDARLVKAQKRLAQEGGGVVFFPPGTYHFKDDIQLLTGIILRGADPEEVVSAHEPQYSPASRFEFPRYKPLFSGDGTPISTAFKGIVVDQAATAKNCGVVNLNINRGYIRMHEDSEHRCGPNRLVFGCVLRNAAGAESSIPRTSMDQPGWLRYTAKFRAAINVTASKNAVVANNRIPQSGDDNFMMHDYPLKNRDKKLVPFDVLFDYDNRPGIYLNHQSIGGAGASGNDGTPETYPWGFRHGLVVRDNYVYNTGRFAIGFCGDGVVCVNNVIRFAKDAFRPTVTGTHVSYGSSTNDNRAVEMRGWRWIVEDNDYEVYSNWCSDRNYRINDGEGLMHEDHCNSSIRDSRLVNNRGNSYLSLFHCGAIDGLHIDGNDISTPGNISDIYVTAPRHNQSGDFPARRITIVNNITRSNGIRIMGRPASDNIVKNNRHAGAKAGEILNEADAVVEGNINYTVVEKA